MKAAGRRGPAPSSRITIRDFASPQALVAAALTVAALVLGGGGTSAPLSELALEVVAAMLALVWLAVAGRGPVRRLPRPVPALCAIVVVLPAVQLVPMPPALWQAMPGHQEIEAALALIGKQDTWQPWTISTSRTLAALLSLGPPLLALAMTATLDSRERMLVIGAVLAVSFASLLLGALQISDGRSDMWRIYANSNSGYVSGFQANRNATADVLLIGLVSVPVIARLLIPRIGQVPARWLAVSACAALALATALTASRTGVVLIVLAIAFAFAIWQPRRIDRRLAISGATVLALACATAVLAAGYNATLGRILSRFTMDGEFRGELWTDTLPAIARYFPFGSGMSTFRSAFLPGERLEVVDFSWPVRAHNDYLELLLEGGVFGIALLIAAVVVIVRPTLAALRQARGSDRDQVLFALATFAIIGLHSIVDYPLRSMALAHLMAVATGVVAAVAGEVVSRRTKEAVRA